MTKTYERCFICDKSGELEAPGSVYSQGTTFDRGRLTVRIAKDGKPVCSACHGVGMLAANELENLSNSDWKADDLSWLYGQIPEEGMTITTHINPDAARLELEQQQAQWRWEDLGWAEEQPLETPQEPVQTDLEAA